MRDSIYRMTLDMHDIASQVQIAVKQYDTARSLYITLMENGKPFTISDGCRAVLSIVRPGNTVLLDDCIIRLSDSVIVYEFNIQTTQVIGINECELKIYGLDGDLLTSPRFTMLVNDNIFNDGNKHGIDYKYASEVISDCNMEGLSFLSSFSNDEGTGNAPDGEVKGILMTLVDSTYPSDGSQNTQLFFSGSNKMYFRTSFANQSWGTWTRFA